LLGVVTAHDGSPQDIAYFWVTGALSAFLDNAPTYLVFFELAGGEARELMEPLAPTLAAISMGAVYMGAMTYIGNAPNLMIYAIAVERGVKMPSFFGYMLGAGGVLPPLSAVLPFVCPARGAWAAAPTALPPRFGPPPWLARRPAAPPPPRSRSAPPPAPGPKSRWSCWPGDRSRPDSR